VIQLFRNEEVSGSIPLSSTKVKQPLSPKKTGNLHPDGSSRVRIEPGGEQHASQLNEQQKAKPYEGKMLGVRDLLIGSWLADIDLPVRLESPLLMSLGLGRSPSHNTIQ
jgi:hypothetical protein